MKRRAKMAKGREQERRKRRKSYKNQGPGFFRSRAEYDEEDIPRDKEPQEPTNGHNNYGKTTVSKKIILPEKWGAEGQRSNILTEYLSFLTWDQAEI